MVPKDLGIMNPWLRNIRDVYRLHSTELNAIENEGMRYNRLVELNVQEQCINVVKNPFVQHAMEKGLEKGMEEGAHRKALAVAERLLAMNFSPEQIAAITQLPLTEIPTKAH